MDITERIKTYTIAKEAYYKGSPIMTDAEFDALEESIIKETGLDVRRVDEFTEGDVEHLYKKMLSQDKAMDNEQLFNWLKKKQNNNYCVTDKIDGMSCELIYENDGTYYVLKEASTRGDGTKGVSIKNKISHFLPKELFFLELSREDTFANSHNRKGNKISIRGELVILKQYKEDVEKEIIKSGGKKITSLRNTVVGIVKESAIVKEKLMYVTFIAWDILGYPKQFEFYSEKLKLLSKLMFITPTFFRLLQPTDNLLIVKQYLDLNIEGRSKKPYEVDGLIFRIDRNEDYYNCGETEHHPLGSIAWKYPPERIETTVLDIEWSSGTTQLTPIAIIEPVVIEGAEISRVAVKSLNNMAEKGIFVGKKVILVRSGGVIPMIVGSAENYVYNEEDLKNAIPEKCPFCGSEVSSTLTKVECSNSECIGKMSSRLQVFAKTLGMLTFGPAVCNSLIKAIDSLEDILFLAEHEFDEVGISSGIARNIMSEISDLRGREVELRDIIAAFSIKGIGIGTATEIARNCTVKDIAQFDKHKISKFLSVKDYFLIDTVMNDFIKKLPGIKTLINTLNVVNSLNSENAVLKGQVVVITGPTSVPREKFRMIIEKNGGKYGTAVSSKTTILVTNETTETTKMKKAKALGTLILNEEEFINNYNLFLG